MCDAHEYAVFHERLKSMNETLTYVSLQLSTAMRIVEQRLPGLMKEFQEIQRMAEYLGISAVE